MHSAIDMLHVIMRSQFPKSWQIRGEFYIFLQSNPLLQIAMRSCTSQLKLSVINIEKIIYYYCGLSCLSNMNENIWPSIMKINNFNYFVKHCLSSPINYIHDFFFFGSALSSRYFPLFFSNFMIFVHQITSISMMYRPFRKILMGDNSS